MSRTRLCSQYGKRHQESSNFLSGSWQQRILGEHCPARTQELGCADAQGICALVQKALIRVRLNSHYRRPNHCFRCYSHLDFRRLSVRHYRCYLEQHHYFYHHRRTQMLRLPRSRLLQHLKHYLWLGRTLLWRRRLTPPRSHWGNLTRQNERACTRIRDHCSVTSAGSFHGPTYTIRCNGHFSSAASCASSRESARTPDSQMVGTSTRTACASKVAHTDLPPCIW